MKGLFRSRGAVALVALALLGTACNRGGGGEPTQEGGVTTIELASIPPFSVTTWPVVVAAHEGYFEEENIEVNFTYTFDGGQLLAGGQADVLNDGADSGVIAAARGKDVIFVAPLAQRVTDGLLVAKDITSVADLAGATLRSSGFGTDEYIAVRFLEENGLSADEVRFVGVEDDGPALIQLENGEIDGGMFDQGFLLEAERSGDFNVLATPEDLGVYPWNVVQTTRTFAEANPDAVVGFVRALQRAMLFIQDPANRDVVIEAVAAEGEGPAEVEATYEAAAGFELYYFEPLTLADVEPALEFLEYAGEDVQGLDLESLIDNSYLERAQA